MTAIDLTPTASGWASPRERFSVSLDEPKGRDYGASPLEGLSSLLSEYFGRRVGFVADPWSQLAEGFLAKMRVFGPDCHAALTPRDFGLDESAYGEVASFLKAGRIDLMEASVRSTLDSVATRWRSLPRKWGVALHWGQFVPLSSWDKLEEDVRALRAEHEACLNDWISNYYTYRATAEIRARLLTEQAYRNAQQLGTSDAVLSRDEWRDMAAFVQGMVDRMMQDYPPIEKIRTWYRLEINQDVIPMPSLAEAQTSWVEQVQIDKQRRINAAMADMQRDKTIKEAEYLEAWAKLSEAQAKASERRRLVEEYAKNVRAELQAKKQEVVGTFYAGFALQIRQRLYESLALVIEGVQTGKISPQSSAGLRLTIGELEAIRLDNDQEIEEMLRTCKTMLAEPQSGKFSTANVSEKIRDLGLVLQLSILSLGGVPRTKKRALKEGGALDIFAELPEDAEGFKAAIRAKRIGLGLEETIGEVVMAGQDLTPTDLRRRRERLTADV